MRNPNRIFVDREKGIKVTRPIKIPNPLLLNGWLEQETEITLNDDQYRFIEHFDPTGSEYEQQWKTEFGEWGTEFYIIYFDSFSGDQMKIQKGDYVYFNYLTYEKLPFNESMPDIKKLVIKNIPRFDGLGVGMIEAFAVAS